MLRDDQWERSEPLLPGKAADCGVTPRDNRSFVEAVLWIMRTGNPWRDLPQKLGHWHRTYVRLSRWRDKGVWERIAAAARGDADVEHLFIDSSIVRAHPRTAGAQKSWSAAHRPLARRAEHQRARGRGRLGQSAAGDTHRRPDCRH